MKQLVRSCARLLVLVSLSIPFLGVLWFIASNGYYWVLAMLACIFVVFVTVVTGIHLLSERSWYSYDPQPRHARRAR